MLYILCSIRLVTQKALSNPTTSDNFRDKETDAILSSIGVFLSENVYAFKVFTSFILNYFFLRNFSSGPGSRLVYL